MVPVASMPLTTMGASTPMAGMTRRVTGAELGGVPVGVGAAVGGFCGSMMAETLNAVPVSGLLKTTVSK